jgi:hypothetical protein
VSAVNRILMGHQGNYANLRHEIIKTDVTVKAIPGNLNARQRLPANGFRQVRTH